MNEWIYSLDEDELKSAAPPLFTFDENPEDAAIFMYREGYPKPMMAVGDQDKISEMSQIELESRPPRKYWEQVKIEIFILICTTEKKYEDLRKLLKEASDKGTKYILATIAGTIGGFLGVEAGVISGFCAILLHSLLRIGKEAYCAVAGECP